MKISIKKDYASARKIEYPRIEDQLDLLYHEGLDAWKSMIEEIKVRHPKPE